MPAAPPPPDGSFAAIYDELRRLAAAKLAHEPDGHTLDATALVHEAYLRLGGASGFESKSQYVRAAAEAMRRILVDHARRKRREARRGRQAIHAGRRGPDRRRGPGHGPGRGRGAGEAGGRG